MVTELIPVIKAELTKTWIYEESIAKVKVLVYKWNNVTQEIIDELQVARENLRDVRNVNGANAPLKLTWNDYCDAIGVTKSTVNRWLALPHVARATGENEWYTPVCYVETAREAMGSIDVDPASTEIGNRIVKATRYYTAEDNGLTKEWIGNIWMNPPYAQPLIADFCNLLVEKYKNGEIKQACVLVNNATETNFFQNMLLVCSAVCFIKGRVKFIGKNGNSGTPLQGQTVLYFGIGIDKFVRCFSEYGVVLYGR